MPVYPWGLSANRLHRVWRITETIANEPGLTRRQLANRENISERQVQADLIMIRDAMRLPLARRGGYRFVCEGRSDGPAGASLSTRDVLTLAQMLARTIEDRVLPVEPMQGLLKRLPVMLPPHLFPLGSRLVGALLSHHMSGSDRALLALVKGMVVGRLAVIDRHLGSEPLPDQPRLTVRPLLLVSCLDRWLVLADCPNDRARIFPLDTINTVTLAGRAG